MQPNLEEIVRIHIENMTASFQGLTRYRRPLVDYVQANHPEFARLKSYIGPSHLLPQDILASAESVISFFLPFDKSVVVANVKSTYTAREWAVAYIETNELIGRICGTLTDLLAHRGFESRWEMPTHNFDPVRLTSRWSHKSIGVIAGLGSFGLHQMVITDAGCAGRFGSLVTSAVLAPSGQSETDSVRCRYYDGDDCTVCVDRCPVGALSKDGFDRTACYKRCLEVDRHYDDLGLTDVCGKCATGPCALRSAV